MGKVGASVLLPESLRDTCPKTADFLPESLCLYQKRKMCVSPINIVVADSNIHSLYIFRVPRSSVLGIPSYTFNHMLTGSLQSVWSGMSEL